MIELENISLDYLYFQKYESLKRSVLRFLNRALHFQFAVRRVHRALDSITLAIQSGDRVGLIGKNGAGKSTLLRILAGIYRPTAGLLQIRGHVSSILNIGVGLNPDMTGYENIVLGGILQGRKKKEMVARFGEIEEYTELGEFLKAPVSSYSAGMRLRLAFAISTSIEPDILLIDEVIGTGDQFFLEKAHRRLNHLINQSSILILASHSMPIIKALCNKVIVLEQGRCVFFGDVAEGIRLYENSDQIQSERSIE